MSVSKEILERSVGKKIRIFLESKNPPFRIGILQKFDDEAISLLDNGKPILVFLKDVSNVEEME